MRKHIKRDDGIPRAGKTIPLVVTQIIEVSNPPAANDQRKHGKLNYQGKPKKPAAVQPKTHHRVEKKSYGAGKFIGDGEKLTAFVWLDEDTAPKDPAAND